MGKAGSHKKKILIIAVVIGIFVVCAWGCAPRMNEALADPREDNPPGFTYTWSASSDCSVCHRSEGLSMEDTHRLAGFHAEEEGLTCITCHEDSPGLAKAHNNVAMGEANVKRLKNTEVSDTVCLSCHSLAELATVLPESVYLVDEHGTRVNPHAVPATEGHDGVNNCSSCHETHTLSSAVELSYKNCTSCHHHEVFECGSCHN